MTIATVFCGGYLFLRIPVHEIMISYHHPQLHIDFIECHVENDLLLIWIGPEDNIITLVRLGSHSELFK